MVKINFAYSHEFAVSSGVPQGSHLGPTLFIMFINDISTYVDSVKLLLYADDAKLISAVNNAEDAALFQQCIVRLHEWCNTNKLHLNIKKCKIMSFYRKKCPHIASYRIENDIITRVLECSDLGVIVEPDLSYRKHIDTIIAKSFSLLGFIRRMCSNMQDPFTLKSLYCALVRSNLEYALVVWHPHYQVHIDRIERIQRKFTRFALRCMNWNNSNMPPYNVRCQLLSLESLHRRRINANIFFIYDLIENNIDAPLLKNQLPFNNREIILRNPSYFYIPQRRTNYGCNEPIIRMCRIFNLIDACIQTCPNRNTFRQSVKSLQDIPQ